MIESIDIFMAKINLQTTILKFVSSIEELQEKHPEREDLIESMLTSLEHLNKYKEVFDQLEESFYIECKTNLRHQMHIADLKQEVLMLKQEIKDLKTEL
jgi:FtsZ-binding cell division protein ZapB|tara:strand:- start:56 stop:352 length:297 start_codon:yes stop_codon:yes gene_type:complete